MNLQPFPGPPNCENTLYLKLGKFFLDRSSIPGLFSFPNKLVAVFLNLETMDFPNY